MTIITRERQYHYDSLAESRAAADPFVQFERWYQDAVNSDLPDPHAMTLATVNNMGRPSARIVLMKSFDTNGFVFFTNYDSQKARELDGNPQAALVFFWSSLERQVRVEGTITKVSAAESDDYFYSRPLDSRLGTHASPQSTVITGRETLEAAMQKVRQQYADGNVPRPEWWGGYCLKPERIEFWQGRPGRLHDRLDYRLDAQRQWCIKRLAP